jgi:molybdopterin molybdotransferase
MISFNQARKIVSGHVVLKKPERLLLTEALGLVLAQDVLAREDGPAFHRSVMDGFAVRSADTARSSMTLKVIDILSAGARPKQGIKKGEAIQIATGTMLPPGADAVVAKEDVRVGLGPCVRTSKRVSRGEFVYFRGSDFKKGTVLLKKGTRLSDVGVALLASQGLSRVLVYPRPSVALVATGDEVVEPGRARRGAQVWNATAPMLLASLRRLGVTTIYLGIARDERLSLKDLLRRGLRHDILLVTGAVSVGSKDLVPSVLAELGVKTLFHRVKMRPGKPILFGRKGRCMVFGLPGNPLSTWIGFSLFVRPVLLGVSGLEETTQTQEGQLAVDVRNTSGRLSFLPARLQEIRGRRLISPLPYSGSADLLAASRADVFFVVPAQRTKLVKGSNVAFMRMQG